MTSATTESWQLLKGSDDYFPSLIQNFQQAQKEIYLETYIFNFEAKGAQVAQALYAAAMRGVRVRILVDGLGTPSIPNDWTARWQAAGVECRMFDPVGSGNIWFPGRWRRMHRKLCVIDKRVAFCGGINILDDWHDPIENKMMQHPRLDYAVAIKGPLVKDIHRTMQQQWQRINIARDLKGTQLQSVFEKLKKVNFKWRKSEGKNAHAALILRDNIKHRNNIVRAYLHAIGNAKKEIIIANAYFFPSEKILRALKQAARRGVRIQLLLQGHYEYIVPYRAAKYMYSQLMKEGVEIWEYQTSYLHAKVAVIDSRWTTVGSSNLDPLSLLLAKEANVVTQGPVFAIELKESLQSCIQSGGQRIEHSAHLNRPLCQRWLDQICNYLLRLAILISGRRYR
ncbi:MAG: cardiolipin synthase ClsB [Betaproteobacteria bacterium]|nr:cardiolipin synthase ClsB [Betaproteobacteria bacterium]